MADAPATVLAVEGVVAGYFADVPILNGVDVAVARGEMVTIVGPERCGEVDARQGGDRAAASVGRESPSGRR